MYVYHLQEEIEDDSTAKGKGASKGRGSFGAGAEEEKEVRRPKKEEEEEETADGVVVMPRARVVEVCERGRAERNAGVRVGVREEREERKRLGLLMACARLQTHVYRITDGLAPWCNISTRGPTSRSAPSLLTHAHS
jgi:hypothetical protein